MPIKKTKSVAIKPVLSNQDKWQTVRKLSEKLPKQVGNQAPEPGEQSYKMMQQQFQAK